MMRIVLGVLAATAGEVRCMSRSRWCWTNPSAASTRSLGARLYERTLLQTGRRLGYREALALKAG